MKVLTHATVLERLGGVELCTFQDSAGLVRRGHDVHLSHQVDGAMRPEYQAAGVHLHGGARFSFAPRSAPLDLVRMLPTALRTAADRPDVLWLQRFEHVVWAQLTGRVARVPVVAHLHHMPMFHRVRELGTGVQRFVAVSEFMRDTWVRAGLPAARVSTVLNAVPEEDYPVARPVDVATARATLGVPADRFVVGHYGRLTRDKGTAVLLDAWEQTGFGATEGHLLLVGDLPGDDPAIADRVHHLVEQGRATLSPTRPDVATILHASDVVAFPSLLPEAFGRVVLEGLLSGRPVVASRVGAVEEVLRGGNEELLFPAGDSTALARTLEKLFSAHGCADPDRWAAPARERFSFERHLAQIEGVLADAARSH